MLKQYRAQRIVILFSDVAITVAVLAVAIHLRPLLPGREITPEMMEFHPLFYGGVALLWHAVFALAGVYRINRLASFSENVRKLTPAHLLASMVFAGILFFSLRDTSRLLVIYFCGANYAALITFRLLLTTLMKLKGVGIRQTTVMIVGASSEGAYLAQAMTKEPAPIFRVVGFVDDDFSANVVLPSPILGNMEDIPTIIKDYEIDFAVIALPENRASRLESLVSMLTSQPVRIYVVSDLLKLALVQGEVERIGDLLLIGMKEPVIQGPQWVTKRIMDVVISGLGLVVLWPLFMVVAILIRLESRGPVFYVATRVGEYGKQFKMYKFRSMYVGAEQRQTEVTKTDESGHIVYKTKADPRVTRVGAWLRRTSIDELPQLWNVLKGDMSLVGPRPEQPFLTEDYAKRDWQRISVPPGITGWWQVRGRSDLPLHLNLEYDIFYVRNYSILLDLKILVLTIGAVLRGKGAY